MGRGLRSQRGLCRRAREVSCVPRLPAGGSRSAWAAWAGPRLCQCLSQRGAAGGIPATPAAGAQPRAGPTAPAALSCFPQHLRQRSSLISCLFNECLSKTLTLSGRELLCFEQRLCCLVPAIWSPREVPCNRTRGCGTPLCSRLAPKSTPFPRCADSEQRRDRQGLPCAAPLLPRAAWPVAGTCLSIGSSPPSVSPAVSAVVRCRRGGRSAQAAQTVCCQRLQSRPSLSHANVRISCCLQTRTTLWKAAKPVPKCPKRCWGAARARGSSRVLGVLSVLGPGSTGVPWSAGAGLGCPGLQEQGGRCRSAPRAPAGPGPGDALLSTGSSSSRAASPALQGLELFLVWLEK